MGWLTTEYTEFHRVFIFCVMGEKKFSVKLCVPLWWNLFYSFSLFL